jgi:sugar-specific transcriptional regulator TrmB
MLEDILKKINVSGTPARIYMELIKLGPCSARRLAETLSLPRPSIYDGLKILQKEDLIVERQEDNKKIFGANDPKSVKHSIEDKISELQEANKELQQILPMLHKNIETVEPKIRFFSGKEGLWKMYREVLWYKDIKIYSVWPIKEIINLFGKEQFEKFHKKREKQNIWIDVVWPHDKVVNYPWLQSNKKQLREIRVAPKDITWDMGYWIFDDKVMFVSSRKELFGFVVQSKDFQGLMKNQFDMLWKASKKFK